MKLRLAMILAFAGIVAAACGSLSEANSYNLPDPNSQHNDNHLIWVRLDSPQNYPTIVYTCRDGDGIYITQDSGSSVKVVPNDPACKGNQPSLTAMFLDNCKVADVLELQRWSIERQEEIGPDGPLYSVKAYANYKRLCAISSGPGTAYLQFKVLVRKFPRKYIWRTLSHIHFEAGGKVDSELRIDLPTVGCNGFEGKWRMKISFPKGMTSGGGKVKPEIDYLPTNAVGRGNGGEFINCKN